MCVYTCISVFARIRKQERIALFVHFDLTLIIKLANYKFYHSNETSFGLNA